MKMHLLPAGRLRMRKSIFFPDAPREATMEFPVSCALLRHPQGNVLFDTGCHPDVSAASATRWGGLAKFMTPIHDATETAISSLAAIGVQPGDIDVAICSHLHPDHCGCTTLLPRAKIICHRLELAATEAADAATQGYQKQDWQGVQFTLIDGEHDLFGDGKIVLLPMPGHTPGMICARVTLERDGVFLLASDTVSVRQSLDQDYAPRNTWNADSLLRSFAEIRRMETQGATVLCGHDAAQWHTLRKGQDFYA